MSNAPLQLTEDDINNKDVLGEKLITLAEIVVRKHYYASYKDKEDLVSVGVLKALNLIAGGGWSKSRGSFHSYLYSGMRNEIHNYLYHTNKFNVVDYDSMSESGVDDQYFEDTGCDIEYSIIHSVCMGFTENFGDCIEDRVLTEMKSLGYHVKGKIEDTTIKHYSSLINDRYGKNAEDDVVGRIIGLIIWKKKENNESVY